MKQVFQNPKSGKTKIKNVIPPSLKRGGVLVKTEFSLISPGTERNIVSVSKKNLLEKARERPDYVQKFFTLWKTKGLKAALEVAKSKLDTDIALGYSASGTVLEVAGDMEGFQPGDRVACAGQDYASHAEFIFVPKNLCVKIPEKVSSDSAAFATIGAIVLQGIRQAELSEGETVGVIGLGFLGQIAARVLKSYGYNVIGFDVAKNKIDKALQSGLNHAILLDGSNYEEKIKGITSGLGVDAVLIYASAKTDDPLKVAVNICRDRGRIVQIGNVISNIPWREFYKKELSYKASRSYGPGRYDQNYEEKGNDYPLGYVRWTEKRNMEEFLRLLNSGMLQIQDLISGVYGIDEGERAYKEILNPKNKSVFGILLKYNPDPVYDKKIIVSAAKDLNRTASVNIGLVGLGSFALSTILPHLRELKDQSVRLYAIATPTSKKVEQVVKAWDVEYVTNDYQELLKDEKINLIICATRHSSHAKIVEDALKYHKNVYVEKPLALTEDDLAKVLSAAENSRGRLFVGFNRRFSKHIIAAKKAFANSQPKMILYRINSPKLESDHWSYRPEEGGRLLGECCHFVDLLNFLTESKPTKISANIIPIQGAVEHEENIIISIEYADGSTGAIFYSALGNFKLPKEYLEIYGSGKIMVIKNFKNAEIISAGKTEKINLWHQNKGYTEELKAIIEAIKNGKPSPMTLEEIKDSHLAVFQALESFKSGNHSV